MFLGSNCIWIERGVVAPYYKCLGCEMERAEMCLEDFRHNKSGNVPTGCDMSKLRLATETQCCPSLILSGPKLDVYDLNYNTAAYPMALTCIAAVGCESELIYTQLLDECNSLCTAVDTRPAYLGMSLCSAMFNSSNKLTISTAVVVLSALIAVLIGQLVY